MQSVHNKLIMTLCATSLEVLAEFGIRAVRRVPRGVVGGAAVVRGLERVPVGRERAGRAAGALRRPRGFLVTHLFRNPGCESFAVRIVPRADEELELRVDEDGDVED